MRDFSSPEDRGPAETHRNRHSGGAVRVGNLRVCGGVLRQQDHLIYRSFVLKPAFYYEGTIDIRPSAASLRMASVPWCRVISIPRIHDLVSTNAEARNRDELFLNRQTD